MSISNRRPLSPLPCKKCQSKVDGFSSDTSPEFEDLMSNGTLEEMEAEVWDTKLARGSMLIASRLRFTTENASGKPRE